MALAMSKAAPLRPDIKLSQALKEYEAVLTEDQKRSFYDTSPLAPNDVMTLTFEINRQNACRRSRVWGARLTTFLNSVKGFATIVDVIIGNSGNPIAGTVWGAVKTAIQAASVFESYFDALSTMLMSVGQSAPRFEKYALLYPASASLRQDLCNYFSVVIDLCKSAILFIRKPFVSQALSVLRKSFDDEFDKFRKDLVRLGDAVKDEVSLTAKQQQSLDSMESARERKENSLFRRSGALFQQETAYQLEKNEKWRLFRLKSRFLDTCSTYNHETALNQARRKGKSSWLFDADDYNAWKLSGTSSVLLCSGIVGSGKTVLCSSVVEELLVSKSRDVSVGFFFCKYDDLESLKTREIIGSLARQFLTAVPEKSFDKVDQDVGGIPLNTEQIVSHLLRILPPKDQYIILLDGLDECEAEETFYLFETLQGLFRSPAHIFKLFWTGRSDFITRVSYRLQPDFHVTISKSNNGAEISNFIELALDGALESGRLMLRDPLIIYSIHDALAANSHEMFLWVAFQIDSICRENTDDGILTALKRLPKDLPTTYRRILRRLRDSGTTDPLVGRIIFQIVAAARRPLNLEEIREAISIEPGNTTWDASKLVNDIMKSLDCCGSLMVVDEELSTIHFAHSSVKQYLESIPSQEDVPEYHISPENANRVLGEILITYLNLDILQGQLINVSKASTALGAENKSLLLKAGLPYNTGASSNLARMFLKNRRTPHFNVVSELEKAAGFTRGSKTQTLQPNSLLSYAQEHGLSDFNSFYYCFNDSSHGYTVCRLWTPLVEGDCKALATPWTSKDAHTLSAHFLECVAKSKSKNLICYTFRVLMNRKERSTRGMQKFLELLPLQASNSPEKRAIIIKALRQRNRAVRGFFGYDDQIPDANALPTAVVEESAAIVELMLDLLPANFNDIDSSSTKLLHISLEREDLEIFELLLKHGADVHANAECYDSVMETAASSRIAEKVIPLLLARGARGIPIKDSYPEEVKRLLRQNHDYRRKKKDGESTEA